MSSESCNSRSFSWLMKSCFPNQQDASKTLSPNPIQSATVTAVAVTTVYALPDDLLLECLSRVPTSSLPSLSLVCRRWSLILQSPAFISLRRLHHLLLPTVFVLSAPFSASLRFHDTSVDMQRVSLLWSVAACLPFPLASLDNSGFLSHARLCSIGPRIYILGRDKVLCYNTWTNAVTQKPCTIFPRKKFAAAVVSGRIYVAGGGPRAGNAVEEYNPEEDTWSVVAHTRRRRFGCIGAAVDGIFYVIGGLKIGGVSGNEGMRPSTAGVEAYVYASSMDLYDVEGSVWLRSRAVPGGGCVVAACAVAGHVYILASHAVDLSFWRFNARRKGGGFGAWCRVKSPPLPAQVRLDSTVRFCCVGVENKVVLIQVTGCIDDLLRRSGRSVRGLKEGLVLVYDTLGGEWNRGPDLPEVIRRAACVTVEC